MEAAKTALGGVLQVPSQGPCLHKRSAEDRVEGRLSARRSRFMTRKVKRRSTWRREGKTKRKPEL